MAWHEDWAARADGGGRLLIAALCLAEAGQPGSVVHGTNN